MNRRDKILRHVNGERLGLEIGPAYAPVAPKSQGFRVHILDHADQETLVRKYPESDKARIEPVDFVWSGEPYLQLVGEHRYQWVIASHVIEHVPDMIGFLLDCDSILEQNGILSLVVPDKRYCFDRFRLPTGIGQVIDNHILKRKQPSPGDVYDYYANTVTNHGKYLWSTHDDPKFRLLMPIGLDRHAYSQSLNGTYYDVHVSRFTPNLFRLVVQDLFALGLCPLKELEFFPTDDGEFFITLSRAGKGIEIDRLSMLELIEDELCDPQVEQKYGQSFSVQP